MAKRSSLSLTSTFFLQLCLGIFFLTLGIMGVTNYNTNVSGFMRFLGRNDALKLVASVGEIVMGGILVLGLVIPVSSALAKLLGIALFIVWGIYMALVFIVEGFLKPDFIMWAYNFSWHAVILVGLWVVGQKYSA
jgi:uncharacterized membrane protein YphA (DoxX/SURF4 family)